MMKSIRSFAAAIAFAMCLPMVAQASSEKSLYEQLGGKESIRLMMDDFVVRLKADPRIGDQFAATDAERLASQLTDQVCEATGGPCKYVGLDMKSAHAGMTITKAHFNALVEVLQTSMNQYKVPFDVQLEVLSMLAPMHRDVITVR
ncbi:group I truncated hemoglobin [Limnobacter profundi]|jgi:hemoglobin|uniref:Group 1 truncated hemoglobin n=1 Tax=Limnobacter profundi TaxID=2732163 RepID=A0ABX6N3C5_9BURK|nr:group 1 truncated hemoglobin [Limnobacter sp. SAORIC-580]QJR28887.1 group 1 truncated hemoglobin [Limnobacter sp. SAORIC-580]